MLSILAISFTSCGDDEADQPNYSSEVTGQYISLGRGDTVEVTSSSKNSLQIKNFGSSTALSSDIDVSITSKRNSNNLDTWLTSQATEVLFVEFNDSTITLNVISQGFTGFKTK